MKRSCCLPLAVALAAVLAACSDVTFEGGGPLTIKLIADRTTASVGQNVTFDFDATGSILDGVVVDYGDGVADTMYTSGAMSAHGQFLHAYSAAGTYNAVATVFDAVQGQDSATVAIRITGG
ncbi:MAG: hypothetical protein FIA95_11950 [Gemmatimonadetes bacterium]|nr:hypothetical protein [Gemmatimonadota bacterium]